MSQPFSFPPPPPPPPRREAPPATDTRGGFRGRGQFRGNYSRGASQAPRGRGSYNNQSPQGGRGGFQPKSFTAAPKRDFTTAFANQAQHRPRAPPAVPSFDIDIKTLLPPKTPSSTSEITKRKSNLLGLTPTDQDASESEDDADDEAKLAVVSLGDGLQFEHRGQRLSLRTPAEIAAWIAERRKRYPTQAKREEARKEAEEKKKRWEEQKQAREEAQRLRRETQQRERNERERQRLKEKLLASQVAKAKVAVAESKEDIASKARSKADKLRKKAERAAKELKLAEQELQRAEQNQTASAVADTVHIVNARDDGNLTDLSDGSDVDDTSSSGLSDTDVDTNSEPEETTSKRTGPEQVVSSKKIPQRTGTEGPPLCKNMIRFGRCKFKKNCRFSHDIQKEKPKKGLTTSGRRKGLYQLMVDKEKEEEIQRALKVIIGLGERGILNEPARHDPT